MDDSRDQQRAERLLVGWLPVALMPVEQRPVGRKGISCSSAVQVRRSRPGAIAHRPRKGPASLVCRLETPHVPVLDRNGFLPVKRHRGFLPVTHGNGTGKKTRGTPVTVYRGSVPVRRHREPVKRHVCLTGGAGTTHGSHKHRPGGHGHASRAQDQLRTGPRLTGGRAHAARTGQPSAIDTSRPTRRPTQERPPAHIVHNH